MSVSSSVVNGEPKNPWLNAWHDPLAALKTMPSLVRTVDLNGDGDFKLCVCDIEKTMKIFKGTQLITECDLLETPVALSVIYTELSMVCLFVHLILNFHYCGFVIVLLFIQTISVYLPISIYAYLVDVLLLFFLQFSLLWVYVS